MALRAQSVTNRYGGVSMFSATDYWTAATKRHKIELQRDAESYIFLDNFPSQNVKFADVDINIVDDGDANHHYYYYYYYFPSPSRSRT